MEQKYARKYAVFFDESEEFVKILKQEKRWIKLGHLPGLLVINKKGLIQYTHYGKKMDDIPENDEI
jgi:hypothetical protein